MKKFSILLLIAALISCAKPETVTVPEPQGNNASIRFELSATHPEDTKAVKTGWENGDVIYVFFNSAETPRYLKMSYNGEWTSMEMNGTSALVGALNLKNGDKVTMRAVYLPFGNGAGVKSGVFNRTVNEETVEIPLYEFDKTYSTYYLTGTLECTVSNNKVSGSFDMSVPEGYVQFYVTDPSASDETYKLGTDAVKPVGLTGVLADGSLEVILDAKAAGGYLPGYAYKGGYLFSGALSSAYSYGSNYYFSMMSSSGVRTDYFVSGKSLSSHISVKLPERGDAKWIQVGSDYSVSLGTSAGIWQTCNDGATVPEGMGNHVSFQNAAANANTQGKALASGTVLDTLATASRFTWTRMSVHGTPGLVVSCDEGFIFLPVKNPQPGYEMPNVYYWGASVDDNTAHALYIDRDAATHNHTVISKTVDYYVRFVSE